MDKVYIDNNKKSVAIELPTNGEVTLIVQDGKVTFFETKTSQKLT